MRFLSQSRVGDETNRKMKIQILGLIFVGLLPFLVSGAAKPNDGKKIVFEKEKKVPLRGGLGAGKPGR